MKITKTDDTNSDICLLFFDFKKNLADTLH